MKKNFLLSFSLFFIPFMAHANGGAQFFLINTSSSTIPDPIHITSGYISYGFSVMTPHDLPAGCPTFENPTKVDLSTVINLPLPVKSGSETSFTYAPPENLTYCFTDYTWANVILFVTQVDDINKQHGECGVNATMHSPVDTAYGNLNIIETNDDFYCNVVSKK